jgi:LCP family protein required for cell wall assembly
MADMPRPRRQKPSAGQPEERSAKERYAGDTQPMNIPPEVYRDEYDDGYAYDAPYDDPAAQDSYGLPDGYDPYDMPRSRRRRQAMPDDYRPPRAASADNEPRSRGKRRRKRRRHSFLGGLLRTVLVLFAAVFILYSAVSLLLISKLDQVAQAPRSVTSGSMGNANFVRNVLIIGTDSRDPMQERGRSDSMILLTFNDASHEVCLTSFLRDAYVQIPNRGADKLNAAYSYGGPELLMDTLEMNFDISVDDYICVSFTGFAGIIDSFGGVKITLSDEEAQAVNNILQSEVNALMGDDPSADLLPSGGTFFLTGKQALSYARIRYVGNADFERTARQREVIEQLTESARSRAYESIPTLITKPDLRVTTNMTTAQMYLLSLRFPLTMLYGSRQQQIPADGTWLPANIDGAAVLQIDTEANRSILRQTVFALNRPSEEQP